MTDLYGCCMHMGLAHHVRVYTEVALSPSFMACSSMWPFERSVHVMSDFQCEWASGNTNMGIDR